MVRTIMLVVLGYLFFMCVMISLMFGKEGEKVEKKPKSTQIYIKHCPFCGGESQLVEDYRDGYRKGYYIYCKECGISQTNVYATEQIAIEKWNKRNNNKAKSEESI